LDSPKDPKPGFTVDVINYIELQIDQNKQRLDEILSRMDAREINEEEED